MQLEPYPEKSGYRVWLSGRNEDTIIEYYDEEPTEQLAIRAGLHGLRADEIPWVRTEGIRRLDTEQKAYKLRVRDGKTGWREVPVSRDFVKQIRMMKNAKGLTQEDPVIDVSKRTVQRCAERAGDTLAEQDGHTDDWQHLTFHDLRRTWATRIYYSLDAHYAESIIMRWGGWTDQDTFRTSYLGRESDTMAAEMMGDANIL
ncbi:tyrosine-type recombinase/integrase [Natrinema salsiterrestre]|uniref:Tyrosine-type recombinase/integrase n=1 Tax=Natrinema salsiterrestre TaxID=2950540 RepID=A0A9Q4L1F1_9EURY|nr:tyrosine-type recombinase/integrase [Natrinema salsiterrestre]MDF9748300.1 tyrosine-type recombinase/integrase [Natrinema salsiterrestre]